MKTLMDKWRMDVIFLIRALVELNKVPLTALHPRAREL